MNGTVSTSKSISDKLTPVLFTAQDMGPRAPPKARAWPRGWQRRCIVPRDSRTLWVQVHSSVAVEALLPSPHVSQAHQTARDRRLDIDGAIWTALLDHA